MIDRRDCMRLREKLAELEKTSKSGEPGAQPPQENSGESTLPEGATPKPSKNAGETSAVLEPAAAGKRRSKGG